MAESFRVLLIFSVIPLTQLYCDSVKKDLDDSRYETKQGSSIPKVSVDCYLDFGQRTEYSFDISKPLYFAGVQNFFSRLNVVVKSFSPMVLNFSNPRNLDFKKILLDLRIRGDCGKVLMQNLAVWANATDLRSIELNLNLPSVMDLTQGNENLASNCKDFAYLQTSINPSTLIDADEEILWPNRVKLFLKTPFQNITVIRWQQLSLSFSSVKKPPEFPWNSALDFFQCMRNVFHDTLSLDYSDIGDLSSHIFRELLRRLQENGLKAVGPSCFRNLEGIQAVNLSYNDLVSLPETLFHGLTSLRYIFLTGNKLSFLKPKLFQGLKNVKRIDLNDNNLNHIPKGSFNSLNKLEFLNLANNKITAINKNIFPRHSPLQHLILQNNYLSAIPTWIFNLAKIEVIDLSSNRITALQGFYKATERLQVVPHVSLNLENNNITTLGNSEQFKRALNYVFLWLDIKLTGNPLYCDCEMPTFITDVKWVIPYLDSFECGWPHKLKKKSIIKVKKNQWMSKEEPENCPAECVCLKQCSDETIVINCEGKSLKELPSSMPQGLIELNLRNNEIKDIPPYPYLMNVTVLKLSNNKIDELQVSTLKNLKHIETLLIDSNQLTSLPRDIETMNFKTLALGQNWFKCDCKIKWMKHWLLKNNSRIKDIEKVLCTSGDTLDQPMFNLSDDQFICRAANEKPSPNSEEKFPTATVMAITLGSLLFLMAIVAILLYKCHGEMKVFMFTHFNWHPFDRIDDSDPTKIYDAFISYSGDDHRWVVETFQQRLEEHDPPYKLCFHYRDFRAGAPIVENILKSVDQSKRMLMVLSPSFARSEWCLLEFRAAHRKVIEDRMNYLIIILLDDVNMAELDEEIKLYMRTNTYVSYSDKWFWQKLFYAMPQQPARESMEAGNVESIESISENHNNYVQTLEDEGLNINLWL